MGTARARASRRQVEAGIAQVEPTTRLAAEVFGVSVPLVMEETASLEARLAKRVKVNGDSNEMSPDILDTWVRDLFLRFGTQSKG